MSHFQTANILIELSGRPWRHVGTDGRPQAVESRPWTGRGGGVVFGNLSCLKYTTYRSLVRWAVSQDVRPSPHLMSEFHIEPFSNCGYFTSTVKLASGT